MDVLKRSELCGSGADKISGPQPLKLGDMVRGTESGRVGVVTRAPERLVSGMGHTSYTVLWLVRGDRQPGREAPYTDTLYSRNTVEGPLNASIVLEDE